MHEVKKTIRFMLYVLVGMAIAILALMGAASNLQGRVHELQERVDSMDKNLPDVSE